MGEKFGLNNSANLGVTIDDLVTLDDMKLTKADTEGTSQSNTCNSNILSIQEILKIDNTKLDATDQSLSCREKNRAKRKARQNVLTTQTSMSSNLSRSNSCVSEAAEPETKKIKVEECVTPPAYEPVPDATGSWGDATDWPLESFCSKLYVDLLSPRWETRHGAATALRELIKLHSDSAGKNIYMSKEEMENSHQMWVEDVTLRLLCVLSLDRFGDFVSDQVVAPVRETCAQVLGAILKQMSIDKIEKTVNILIMLTKQKEWEVRHGGLLGMKYLLVVREVNGIFNFGFCTVS